MCLDLLALHLRWTFPNSSKGLRMSLGGADGIYSPRSEAFPQTWT